MTQNSLTSLNRVVEFQAKTVTRLTTDNQEEYDFIESLVEMTKPEISEHQHHYLIRSPFRYPLPVPMQYQARFRPPFFQKNAFFGAEHKETAIYESAYHWLRQRVHLDALSQVAEPRTQFNVKYKDPLAKDIRKHPLVKEIMDKDDYYASHQFVKALAPLSSIIYPSCRDPKQRACVAVFDIEVLGLEPEKVETLYFIYDSRFKKCQVQYKLEKQVLLDVYWEANK